MNNQTDDIDRIVNRLNSSLKGEWESCIYGAVEQMQEVCESPIEVMLGSALMLGTMLIDGAAKLGKPFFQLQKQSEIDLSATAVAVVPQYSWKNYRIDFALLSVNLSEPIFVECDGHDFHERTKEQAARDRSKDREIQQAGITVLRFTGSEIYRDPSKCGAQILSVACNKAMPPK